MRYFVTGATGFIGGEVARQLREAGHEVRALVRNPEASTAVKLNRLGVECHRGDIRDASSLRAPMDGCDGVFHIAAWYKVGVRGGDAYDINVVGTRHVLTTMRNLEIPKGVYTSTIAIYSDTHGQLVDESYRYEGEPMNRYEATKSEAHYEVALPMIEDGLPLVVVLPGVVYGPGDTGPLGQAIRDYLRRRLPVIPRDTEYSWAHVEDIAAGHIAAMETGTAGASYNLAGPRHSMAEVFDLAQTMTGIPAPRIRLGRPMLLAASKLMGVVERVVPVPSNFCAESLRSVAGITAIASSEKARRELGFDPRPIDVGLRETLDHELEQLKRG